MRHTDLSRNDSEWEYQDDPVFAQRFRRDILICVVIGFLATIGIIAVVVNADAIDNWFSEVLKSIFL